MAKRVVRRKVRARREPRRRRSLPVLTPLLALITAGAVVAAVLVVGGGSSAVRVSERTVTVTDGVIQTVVSGSGNLEPEKQQDVDFATSGKVVKIYVHTGERIDKGDLIARLDSSTQQVAVSKADADLVDAQDALTKAQEAATATPTPTAVAVAAAAQATPTATAPARGRATPTATPSATAAPRATATAQAQQQQSSGQSVESAEAAVQSAQLALTQAQDDLEATTLRAPISGTVASIGGAVGDTVGSSNGNASAAASGTDTSFVVLANLRRLKMEVALSESDIGKVKKGQSASVTINAASGEKVAAHVTSVGVLASSSSDSTSGAVSYPVDVTLDQTTQGIKAGMSATADIVVAQASGLLVPSQALRGSSVTLERKGQRSTQRVETGVVGDSETQVVSGLQAGDKVVVTSTTAALGQAASNGQTGTGLGGAGDFGAPGGGFGGGGTGGFGGARFQRRGG